MAVIDLMQNPAQLEILYPVFALVALTWLVWLRLFIVRVPMVLTGEVPLSFYVAKSGEPPPERERVPTHHLANLFEMPILFYALTGFLLITGGVDETMMTLAWVYVGARFAHAVVHLSYNDPNHRVVPYMIGCGVLLAMWLRFFGYILELTA